MHGRGLHRGEHAGTVNSDGGIQIIVLALHHLAVLDVDIDTWHLLGTIRQPVYVNTILATERHHLVCILRRLNRIATVIIRILGDMPQAELREDKVEAVSSLVQLQSQVAIVVAEVNHWTLVSLALSHGQSVLFGVKRANRLPLRTIFRGIERQFQRSIVASVACRVVKTDAAFGFLQGNVDVGFRLVYHLFLLLRDVPCAVVDGADITVEHLSETFPVFSWQIAREHACVESYRRFDKLIDIIAPLSLLHQHLFIHTLARHRYGIVAIYIEAQAALLAQLPLTTNEDACRVVAHLYRWCEPLADGAHRSGDDAIACDVGHNIREHLVVVFVVELQLHDARQTAHHLLLREGGNRVHRCLVVAKCRIVCCHHAQLPVDVLRVA